MDYLSKLFIDEAKPALKRHSGGSGGSGGDDITDLAYFFRDGHRLDLLTDGIDTSKTTNFSYMFDGCNALAAVPELDTSNGTTFAYMFNNCKSLTSVPKLDTSKGTLFSYMLRGCRSLTSVPELDTSLGNEFLYMFEDCTNLVTIPKLDMRNSKGATGVLNRCGAITNLKLYNINFPTTIGSGTSYGHLLTLDSLLHTIRELIDTGRAYTLTMGNANLEKLANVYVRTIDITDEMRAEDEFIDKKLPFEVCESTDEGATLITDYVLMKNWQLK